ncbi:MAG: futalosine hydrolase [Trueperaceae bacterium]
MNAIDADARRPMLVIGATDLELDGIAAGLDADTAAATAWGPDRRGFRAGAPVVVQALGLGKANTAAGLAIAIAELRPAAVLQVGIGGAYVGSFLSVGMAMLATEDVQLDLGLRRPEGWADWGALGFPLRPRSPDVLVADAGDRGSAPVRVVAVPTDRALTDAIAAATGLPQGRFATLDAVTHDVHLGTAMQAAFDVSVESMEGAAAAQTALALGIAFAEVRAVSNVVGERDKANWNLRGAVRVARDIGLRALDALAADPRWGAAG